jgi:hypothetical protein
MHDHHVIIPSAKYTRIFIVEAQAKNITQMLFHHRSWFFFVEQALLYIPH